MNYVTQAIVIDIIEHNKYVREYVLELDKDRKYNPGSFVQLSLDIVTASDIWPDSRTFSIASYEKGVMHFIIKNVGIYTFRIFNELKIGTRCTIKFPFGDLFNKNLKHEKHVFIAGGLGITPFLSLVKYFKDCDLIDNVFLFYSVKYLCDLVHYDELKSILGKKISVYITKEKKSDFNSNRIDIQDIKNIADVDTNIYLSGSKSFIKEYKELLFKNGYKKIHMDEWE